MNTYDLSRTERLALIRFCLIKGNRIKCSTTGRLLRPLKICDLEAAFEERAIVMARTNEEYYENLIKGYKEDMLRGIAPALKSIFGTENPSVEEFEEYANRSKKEGEKFDIRKSYSLTVDYESVSEDVLSFHNSMNPRVTFGYSNYLHEECDSEITEAIRRRLLPCFNISSRLLLFKSEIDDFISFGRFTPGDMLFYEDVEILCGDRKLLSTITHEKMFDLFFNDEDINEFRSFEDKIARNEKALKKLHAELKY